MTIQKCDKCGKIIKTEPIRVGVGWSGAELCQICGKEIIDFLVKNHLQEEKLVRHKMIKSSAVSA